ncbi:MAG: alpha/beta hydrolase [Spirosomataceae bacterium]
MKFGSLIVVLILGTGLSSCFKKYIVSEKEIRAHYDTLVVKPKYQTIKGEKSVLFCATFGSDTLPPVLFLHGAPGRWEGFTKQLDDSLLQHKFHLIAPDRPGYGKSYFKRKYRKTDIVKQAEMLHAALALNHSGKQAILVSRSYGGPIGALMTYKYPEAYSKHITMAPAVNPAAEKFFKFSKYGKWPVARWIIPKRFKTATDEKYDHIEELCNLEPIWEEIKVPTVLMYGGRDWVVSRENFEYVKQRMNPEYLKPNFIPDAGHRISRSHAGLLREEILNR